MSHSDLHAAATLALGGREEMLIFFRADGWYPVQGCLGKSLPEQAADNAVLNPGTRRVEDIDGNVLWSLQ